MKNIKFLLLFIFIFSSTAFNQVTKEDYQRAEKFLPSNLTKLVYKNWVSPNWIEKTSKFWYRLDNRDGKEFILVDCENGTRVPAFDHEKLAEILKQSLVKEYDPFKLPFDHIDFVNNDKSIKFNLNSKDWTFDLTNYNYDTTKVNNDQQGLSPDKKWVALIKDYNLYIRSTETNEEMQLTNDGMEFYDYAASLPSPRQMIRQGSEHIQQEADIKWTPDSKKIVTYRIDQRGAGKMHLIQSVPPEGVRPKVFSYAYPLPGDTILPKAELLIFDIESKKKIQIENDPIQLLYYGDPWWYQILENNEKMYFLQLERGLGAVHLREVDLSTGKTRTVFTETSETCVDPGMWELHVIEETNEIIWASERDGWNHLYLFDLKTGKLKKRITSGEYVVRYVMHVDKKERQIYFIAAGKEPGRNLYYRFQYKVNFDGSGLKLLSPENADHVTRFSPDGKYFLDNYSKVDMPNITVLRRSSDGKTIMELEKADIKDLLAIGWTYPEEVKLKARDGQTDIYGIVHRPSNFDPSKKYPVIDKIYTGPHSYFVAKSFWAYESNAQNIAELGFIVVQIDGMGTGKRSKEFHNVSYKNLKDGGLPDHIAGMKQLAKKYPYMDLDRVGVYGFSAGGYDVVNAMVSYPDFYKVGVSASGNHDHRMDKAWWNELWMDFPVKEHYIEQSNLTHAHKLKGKLLLVHGELDDNVNPYATMQLVDVLIKENKDFDFLIMPNQHHYLNQHPYFIRKRWDFFVRHLLGQEPLEYKVGELGKTNN